VSCSPSQTYSSVDRPPFALSRDVPFGAAPPRDPPAPASPFAHAPWGPAIVHMRACSALKSNQWVELGGYAPGAHHNTSTTPRRIKTTTPAGKIDRPSRIARLPSISSRLPATDFTRPKNTARIPAAGRNSPCRGPRPSPPDPRARSELTSLSAGVGHGSCRIRGPVGRYDLVRPLDSCDSYRIRPKSRTSSAPPPS